MVFFRNGFSESRNITLKTINALPQPQFLIQLQGKPTPTRQQMDALFCPGHAFVFESVNDSSLDYNEPFVFYMNDFIEALCLHIIHETVLKQQTIYFGYKGDHIANSSKFDEDI